MTRSEVSDEVRYGQSTQMPSREMRELLQHVFLGTDQGRTAFAFLISRYAGETPILNERQRHEHNVIVDLKNIIGWGHTLPSIHKQVETLYREMIDLANREVSDEVSRRG